MLFLLLACVSDESYVHKFGTISCERMEECNKADFENLYDDQEECMQEWEANEDDWLDCLADCTYTPKDGSNSLAEYRNAECNDSQSVTDLIFDAWSCDDEISVTLCLGYQLIF